MPLLSYSDCRFPPDIIQRAVWMYLRFALSFPIEHATDVLTHHGERTPSS